MTDHPLIYDLITEIERQDRKHGPFEGTILGRSRLAIACLEDEVAEAREAWRGERKALNWDATRAEVLQVAAVAVRALRDCAMTDPSTPVPSDEAVEAAAHALCAWPTVAVDDREHSTATHMSVDALTAAYAIDAPRIAAEAAAEARADYDDFIEGLTAKLNDAGVPAMPSWPDAIDWLILFNPEANDA